MPESQVDGAVKNPLHPRFNALFTKVGLTQTAVAQEMGIAQSSVSTLAHPDTPNKRPSAKVISGLERLEKKYRHVLKRAA
jgi:predicted transcriptional regulator